MIEKVDHVALIVRDIDQTVDYYSTLFGFRVRARGESKTSELCFLYHENQPGFEIELIRNFVPETYSEKGVVNHLAFTVGNMEETIDFFHQKGVKFLTDRPNVTFDGRKTIFFFGPNNERLQFVQRK